VPNTFIFSKAIKRYHENNLKKFLGLGTSRNKIGYLECDKKLIRILWNENNSATYVQRKWKKMTGRYINKNTIYSLCKKSATLLLKND
jgi:hypothetical protein